MSHRGTSWRMAAAATSLPAPISACCSNYPRTTCKNVTKGTVFLGGCSKNRRSLPVRFARSSRPLPEGDEKQDAAEGLVSSDDLGYLGKLAAGSVGGAAAIKYGSAFFPEIAKPNLFLALLMIFLPVVVSMILLLKESD